MFKLILELHIQQKDKNFNRKNRRKMSNFIIYVYIFGGSLLLHLPNVFSIDSGKCANEFGTCKAIFLHQNEINENFSTLIENNSNGNVNNGTKFQIEIDSTNQYENGTQFNLFSHEFNDKTEDTRCRHRRNFMIKVMFCSSSRLRC